jgi:hypothetical protein
VNLTFQTFNPKTATYSDPVSLGIGASKCGCSAEASDPKCRNRSAYVIDFEDKKPVALKECPNRFDDAELWAAIHFALNKVGSWDKVLGFYGVPVALLSEPVYHLLDLIFAARDRYQAQKALRES